MSETALLHHLLLVGAMLFGIGLVGFLSRRNMIVMFLSAEMLLQGVSVSLVGWSRLHGDLGGQALVLFVIAVAACEAAVALALVLVLYRRRGSLDVALWRAIHEPGIEPPEPAEPLAEPRPAPDWPTLPPAGRRPEIPPEKTDYRRHV
ncbi:MAG: NADH-quinone oxidoreductase subunit NuoK [Pirellulales bacterium]|nr:NADH-quinone oxidoreductase subunit NuoK [Pirellulales bacterium]